MSDPNLIDNNGKIRKIGREFDEHPLMSPKKLQTDGLEGLLDKAKTFTEWNLKDFYRVCEKEKCNKYGFEWLRSYGITVCCGSWQAGYCTERILKNSSLILAEDVVGFFKDRTFFEKERSLRKLSKFPRLNAYPNDPDVTRTQLEEYTERLIEWASNIEEVFGEAFLQKSSGVEAK